MLTRIISGAIGLVLFFAVMLLGEPALSVAVFLLSSIGIYEVLSAIGFGKHGWFLFTGVVTSVLFVFAFEIKAVYIISYLLVLFIFLVMFMLIFHEKYSSKDIFSVFILSVIIPFAFSSILRIRNLENGSIFVWFPFVAAWVTDTFAYFTGRFFGKHKLIEKISPKKTVEGSIGGILGALAGFIIFAVAIGNTLNMEINWLSLVILAVTSSVLSQLGDLFASAIKRENGIKDFGNIMPGHGGVLDRFDSLILTAPYIYLFLQIIPVIKVI